ncbi:MAG TPA: RluA family pseudouridine synthase [Nitrospirae bacterium]|nr:RluA family pseudouridine synthase [Nitrospirota bacterium]
MTEQTFSVSVDDDGQRIDVYLSSRTSLSRSSVQELISSGAVTVNGTAVKPSYRVRMEDRIQVIFPERETTTLVAEPLPIEVIYRDEDLIVVNKPPGMVMYPAAGHSGGTLMNAIARHTDRLATVGAPVRPGVVHRIDKDTSGLVVVALSDEAYYGLVSQFKERTIERRYIALVYGSMKEDAGEIELKIGRSPLHRKKMSTRVKRGKPARTAWRVLEHYSMATMIAAKLATGRTHQIRVHFSALGHPVLGDRDYGKKTSLRLNNMVLKIPRQMLHAKRLGFSHPVTGKWLEFRVPLPEDMMEIVRALRGAID